MEFSNKDFNADKVQQHEEVELNTFSWGNQKTFSPYKIKTKQGWKFLDPGWNFPCNEPLSVTMTQEVRLSVHFEETIHDSLHHALCVRVIRVFVKKAHCIRITYIHTSKLFEKINLFWGRKITQITCPSKNILAEFTLVS